MAIPKVAKPKEFSEAVKKCLKGADGSKYTQAQLAAEIGIDASELNRKLKYESAANSSTEKRNRKSKLTDYDVRNIVIALARFKCITTRQQAIELLDLMNYSLMEADWTILNLKDSPNRIKRGPIANKQLPNQNLKFVGREAELAHLHTQLQTGNLGALTVLHGMGGAGKTSLALEYLYRYQAEYAFTFWIPAENAFSLKLAFIGLASQLGLGGMLTDTEDNQAGAIQLVKAELAHKGKELLLVFDNASQPEDIDSYRPGGAGHVIVTSRSRQWGRLGNTVEVNVLIEEDALRLLAAHVYPGKIQSELLAWGSGQSREIGTPEESTARELVKELGYLALAIAQAGAYIHASGCGIAEYLAKVRGAAVELFGATGARLLDYNEATVATTWLLSFKEVMQKNPDASGLLYMLAFFAPEKIKLSWFTVAIKRQINLSKISASNATQQAGIKLDEILTTLLEYSLVTRNGFTGELGMHRLVQLVIREKFTSTIFKSELNPESEILSGYNYWLNWAIVILVENFPDATEYANWAECDALLSHQQAAIDHCDVLLTALVGARNNPANKVNLLGLYDADLAFLERVGILFGQAATHYHQRLFYTQARPLYEWAIAITEGTKGSKHPNLAIKLHNLAELYRDTGEYAAALPLYKRAIAITEGTKGSEHPDLAPMLSGLATALFRHNGDYASAKSLYERAITITENSKGKKHPDVAKGLNNLAELHRDVREYAAACPLYKRAIAITKNAYGSDHPDLAPMLNNLALLLQDTGKYAAARRLYERAISIGEKTLVSNHPDVAIWRSNLAGLLSTTGKKVEALELFTKALAVLENRLGSTHPNTRKVAQWLSQLENELAGNSTS